MTRALAVVALFIGVFLRSASAAPQEKQKSYRLPSTDLKQRIIWGSSVEVSDGPSLAFGGQDQQSDDGSPHTRIKVGGEWKSIQEELEAKNAVKYGMVMAQHFIPQIRRRLAAYRWGYFESWFPPRDVNSRSAKEFA
ncbi:MAG TPA: hypothetical protein VKU80_15110, partial [Planctomycetota bacterium]|nr:hypothetical protein [Planctomycetota bacterium]